MSAGFEKRHVYSRMSRIAADLSIDGPSNTDFVVHLGNSLQNVKRVSFVSVIFSNNAYNITTDNNQFSYTRTTAGVPTASTITIVPGFYDLPTLLAAINSALQADSVLNPVLSWESAVTKYVFATMPAGLDSFVMTDTGRSGWFNIGFYPTPVTLLPSTATRAQILPTLQGLDQVYLHSVALAPGNSFDENGNIHSCCIGIPVVAPFGGTVVFECKVDALCEITYPTPRNIQTIDIKLIDRFGKTIDLQGSNVKLDLRLWFDQI